MSYWKPPDPAPCDLYIRCHDWLPPGTIFVSPDVWRLLLERCREEQQDQNFLRSLGIGAEENR